MVEHPVLLAADIKQATLDEAGSRGPRRAAGLACLKLKGFHPPSPTAASAVRSPGAAAQGESRTVSTVARGENGQPVSYGPRRPSPWSRFPPPSVLCPMTTTLAGLPVLSLALTIPLRGRGARAWRSRPRSRATSPW